MIEANRKPKLLSTSFLQLYTSINVMTTYIAIGFASFVIDTTKGSFLQCALYICESPRPGAQHFAVSGAYSISIIFIQISKFD